MKKIIIVLLLFTIILLSACSLSGIFNSEIVGTWTLKAFPDEPEDPARETFTFTSWGTFEYVFVDSFDERSTDSGIYKIVGDEITFNSNDSNYDYTFTYSISGNELTMDNPYSSEIEVFTKIE